MGQNNTVSGNNSLVGDGFNNTVGSTTGGNPLANCSFVGGGEHNQIDSATAATGYGFIGGGQDNIIGSGTFHSFIGGGKGNSVTGNCSAILGGSGNNDGGFSNVGMFGNALTATVAPATYGVPSAFWADTLVAPSIPLITTPGAYALLPTGALYFTTPGSTIGSQPLYIK